MRRIIKRIVTTITTTTWTITWLDEGGQVEEAISSELPKVPQATDEGEAHQTATGGFSTQDMHLYRSGEAAKKCS